MANPQDQTENERFIVDHFFSIMGTKADSIERGPDINGNDKPDFIVCIDGKRIGIEETTYHRGRRRDELRPRQANESAWPVLQKAIEEARRSHSELKGIHGAIRFKNFVLPSSKQYRQFAEESVKFAVSMLDGLSSDHKRFKTFDVQYPLLKKHVEYLELQQVECYMFWDWRHNADGVSLEQNELLGIIQAKIRKHEQSEVDENWLLITSRTQLSQQMGHLSVGELDSFEDVCDSLQKGPFNKVYIYDYMRSRVFVWSIDGGWLESLTAKNG
jgi:hypothetical protein